MNFRKWLDKNLTSSVPDCVIAFNFNLYERKLKNHYMAELTGCERYSVDDDDWACETVYSSGKSLYAFTAESWENALEKLTKLLRTYLDLCDSTNRLKQAQYITAGFAEGNLVVIER